MDAATLDVCLKHGEGFAAFSVEIKKHAALWISSVQRFAERLHIRYRLAVHLGYDVFALNVLRRRDAVVFHIRDNYPLLGGQMQPLGNFLREFLYLQSKFAYVLRFRFARLNRPI